MKNIYDNRNNVLELQTFLRAFSRGVEGVPIINPDGIFGPETVEALRIAQKKLGLAETGVADFGTWQALFEFYSR